MVLGNNDDENDARIDKIYIRRSLYPRKKLDLSNLELRNEIGYIIETPYSYPDLTVRENLEIVSKLRGVNKEY